MYVPFYFQMVPQTPGSLTAFHLRRKKRKEDSSRNLLSLTLLTTEVGNKCKKASALFAQIQTHLYCSPAAQWGRKIQTQQPRAPEHTVFKDTKGSREK